MSPSFRSWRTLSHGMVNGVLWRTCIDGWELQKGRERPRKDTSPTPVLQVRNNQIAHILDEHWRKLINSSSESFYWCMLKGIRFSESLDLRWFKLFFSWNRLKPSSGSVWKRSIKQHNNQITNWICYVVSALCYSSSQVERSIVLGFFWVYWQILLCDWWCFPSL